MKKIIYTLTLLSFVLFSCNNDSNPAGDDIRLTRISSDQYEDGVFINNRAVDFIYGDDNYVLKEEFSNGKEVFYTYNNDNQITEVRSEFEFGRTTTYAYIYSVNGNIFQKWQRLPDGDDLDDKYQYNTAGQLVASDLYFLTYYSDGNIASITNNSGLVDNLEYDNKNSYYNLLYPEAYRKINFWSNNNVVSRSRPAVTIDIEYNSQNYPTRRTSSYIDHNGVNQTVIYEYFYE